MARSETARGGTTATLLSCALLCTSVAAQEIDQPAPPVVVEGEAPEPAPDDPTAFTRVVELDDREGESPRLEEILEAVPGVFVRRFGGEGERSEVSIRGSSGAQVVVLLDGVRLNSAESGTVDLSSIPMELIERVEVTRGGGSVDTGSDAIGGVVNLVTRRASARPRTRITAGGGPYDTWRGSFSQTGRLGPVEALVGYDGFKTSGDWKFEPLETGVPDDNDSVERINNRSERHGGLLKLGSDLGRRSRLELTEQIDHIERGEPGLDTAQGLLRGQSPDGHLRRTRNVAQLRFLHATKHVDAELRGFHRFERSRFSDDFRVPAIETDDRNSSYGGRARLGARWGFGPLAWRPALGAELRRDELDPLGAGFQGRRVLGVFLQNELGLFSERVVLVSALRFDETQGQGSEWIPRVGLVLRPTGWLELRGNAERAYRVPNFEELFVDVGSVRGNPNLRPEDARVLDAGGRLHFGPVGPLRKAEVEAAFFYNEIDDSIVFQPVSPNVIRATNIPNARVRGVEVSGRLELLAWLAVSGSWTHLDTRIRRTRSPLPGRAEDEYDLRVELAPWKGLVKWVGELHHRDRIPANEGGTVVLEDLTTFDASASVEVGRLFGLAERLRLESLRVSVIGTNVTDRAARDALSFPQPGRIVSVRVEASR